MDEQDLYPESSRSLEGLRQMRLLALLSDLIDDGGKVQAAKTLGVNYRSLARAVESGRLTPQMRAVLEAHLLLGGGSAAARQRERIDALEKRLSTSDEETRAGLKALVGEVRGLRQELDTWRLHVERRLLRLEDRSRHVPSPQAGLEPGPPKRPYVPRDVPPAGDPGGRGGRGGGVRRRNAGHCCVAAGQG